MMFNLSELNLHDVQSFILNGQLELTTAWVVLAIGGLAFLFSSLLLIRGRRKFIKRLNEIQDLQHDLRAITAAAIGVGERVLELERRQRRGVARLSRLPGVARGPSLGVLRRRRRPPT